MCNELNLLENKMYASLNCLQKGLQECLPVFFSLGLFDWGGGENHDSQKIPDPNTSTVFGSGIFHKLFWVLCKFLGLSMWINAL